jgi:hypothetical protein
VFATVSPVRAARSSTLRSPYPRCFEQFQSMRMTERLGDLGEADEHTLFGTEA